MSDDAIPERKEAKKSEALWLMSFSDMSLVLLCFFVLMISTMKPIKEKFEHMKEGMVKDKTISKENLHSLAQKIKKVVKDKKLDKAATITQDIDGLQIEFKDGFLFRSGSAASKRQFRKVVHEVMKVIAQVGPKYRLKIEGHTDDAPLRGGGRYPTNWELSAARGFAIMRQFQNLGVDENKMSVIAYAHTRPKVPYKKMKGKRLQKARSANRRVVIWIE